MQKEKIEDAKMRIVNQLRQKVRKHRPAKKVLELEAMLVEDQLEMLSAHRKDLEWTLGYLNELDPAEIEPENE